jgi:hypothetical protein
VNRTSVHLHLGAEGQLPMAYGVVVPVDVVAVTRKARGRGRPDWVGDGLEWAVRIERQLGRLRKNSRKRYRAAGWAASKTKNKGDGLYKWFLNLFQIKGFKYF